MTGPMDDRMNGRMNDRIDGWNDDSLHDVNGTINFFKS